jgi:hypothetical protein
MAIPANDLLEQFLSGLSLSEASPGDDFERFELLPKGEGWDDKAPLAAPPIHVWYPRSSQITPHSVIARIVKEAIAVGHSASDQVARSLLALYCTCRLTRGGVGGLNELFENVGRTDVSEAFVTALPPFPGTNSFAIGRFNFGPLDRNKLLYHCEKAKCDFFERYPNEFRNRFAIWGNHHSINMVDFSKLGVKFNTPLSTYILDKYFSNIAVDLRQAFIDELAEAQLVIAATGVSTFDMEDMRSWPTTGFVCMFSRVNGGGNYYFCPFKQGPVFNFNCVDQRFPARKDALEKEFGFTTLGSSGLHQTVRSFCRFVAKARQYQDRGDKENALLHYMIALDLLFGEQDASNEKIGGRTAALVHEALNMEFSKARKRIRHLYDVRSKYVHSGKECTVENLEEAEPIITEVLYSLLRLSSRPDSQEAGFIALWLKSLDLLVATHDAGRSMDRSELERVGSRLLRKTD